MGRRDRSSGPEPEMRRVGAPLASPILWRGRPWLPSRAGRFRCQAGQPSASRPPAPDHRGPILPTMSIEGNLWIEKEDPGSRPGSQPSGTTSRSGAVMSNRGRPRPFPSLFSGTEPGVHSWIAMTCRRAGCREWWKALPRNLHESLLRGRTPTRITYGCRWGAPLARPCWAVDMRGSLRAEGSPRTLAFARARQPGNVIRIGVLAILPSFRWGLRR